MCKPLRCSQDLIACLMSLMGAFRFLLRNQWAREECPECPNVVCICCVNCDVKVRSGLGEDNLYLPPSFFNVSFARGAMDQSLFSFLTNFRLIGNYFELSVMVMLSLGIISFANVSATVLCSVVNVLCLA